MVRVNRSPQLQELSDALHRAAFLIGVSEFNGERSPEELDDLARKVLQTISVLLGDLSGRHAKDMTSTIQDVLVESLAEIKSLGVLGGGTMVVHWDVGSAVQAYRDWVEDILESA